MKRISSNRPPHKMAKFSLRQPHARSENPCKSPPRSLPGSLSSLRRRSSSPVHVAANADEAHTVEDGRRGRHLGGMEIAQPGLSHRRFAWAHQTSARRADLYSHSALPVVRRTCGGGLAPPIHASAPARTPSPRCGDATSARVPGPARPGPAWPGRSCLTNTCAAQQSQKDWRIQLEGGG